METFGTTELQDQGSTTTIISPNQIIRTPNAQFVYLFVVCLFLINFMQVTVALICLFIPLLVNVSFSSPGVKE